MTTYTCEKCNYNTNSKYNYERHINSDLHYNYKKGFPTFICKYCEQTYKHKSSLSKHIKYSCTKNKDEDLKELVRLLNSQLQVQSTQLQSQNQQLQSQAKQIEKLMGKLEITGSFNTTNIQNNIQLLPYKNSDTSHLTNKDYESCIKKVNFCVMKLIEKIHFNPEKPENMNIYISNMKNKYLMVYDGKNWNIANKVEEIDKLYEEKELMLEEWLDAHENTEIKDKFIKYLNNKENDETLNMIKDELKLMMYNKKQLLEN
jgi:hypothetical protein